LLHKYFIAIVPPEPLLASIHDLKQRNFEIYSTKGALRSPGHITLHMPFTWEEEKENKLVDVLKAFKFHQEIQITLSNFDCFEPRVLFINVSQNELLNQFQKELVSYCKSKLQLFNQADDRRGFHPHITIAFRDLKKPTFYKMWNDYQNVSFEANFTCGTICLLKQLNNRWEVYKEMDFL